ncbi:hypothetical protein CDAR_218331 [Caerostris darwini]|uniref:Uncharacterized protein n=1 Tax=Caerostris darwini TaxID=1538125 RepID=A0AAV4R8G0_9ARAC|nr:hypothetical protein CDAR_218331 [Caerostris darwini]
MLCYCIDLIFHRYFHKPNIQSPVLNSWLQSIRHTQLLHDHQCPMRHNVKEIAGPIKANDEIVPKNNLDPLFRENMLLHLLFALLRQEQFFLCHKRSRPQITW